MKFDHPVILVGGGDCHFSLLQKMISHYPGIAVDGGIRHFAKCQHLADLHIGDMDSSPAGMSSQFAKDSLIVSEQDSTDFEKALYSIDAPLFISFGFAGGRFDHQISALHIMQKYHKEKAVILVTNTDIIWFETGAITLDLSHSHHCAILPFSDMKFAHSSGLAWPVDNHALGFGHALSSSNSLIEDRLMLQPEAGYEDVPYCLSADVALLPHLLAIKAG